jgi:molecular chaperone Hsp33
LAITFDQALTGERYQGIVPLEGASLAEAAQSYFAQSEQIPSLVRLAHRHDKDGVCIAGGMLLQHLPEGEEGRDRLHTRLDHPEWQHVEALGRTVKDEELTDSDLPMETLVWRLFHDEKDVRVLGGATLTRGCRCNREHILDVLSRFPADEQTAMADAVGTIRVDCAFCSISHPFRLDELAPAA